MNVIKQILCPLDLSETSSAAFDYAATLARWHDASLTVLEMIWVGVSSLPPARSPLILTDTLMREYSQELQRFVEDKNVAGVRVTALVREGPIDKGILEHAASILADLIVMGTHGRGGFERF